MIEAPDTPAFWEATDERGLIFYQGDSVIRIPKDKLPNLMLFVYATLFSILNTLHNWLIMTLVFKEFPQEFFTTQRLKRLKLSGDPKKRELADMLGGFLNRQDKGHY